MNMCSVRHRPMPSAPSSRAFFASSGVSALARTPRRRISSAHSSTRSKYSSTSRVDERHVLERHAALGAVDGDEVALADHRAVDADRLRARGRSRARSRRPPPGAPMPRATSAACEALPPSEVRMPLAAWKPATSSASVNGRTRITSRPSLLRPRPPPAAVNTTSPLAAPGEALTPVASTSNSALGSKVGCSSASSELGSIVASASSLVEQPLVDGVAARSAPRPAPGAWRCASGA